MKWISKAPLERWHASAQAARIFGERKIRRQAEWIAMYSTDKAFKHLRRLQQTLALVGGGGCFLAAVQIYSHLMGVRPAQPDLARGFTHAVHDHGGVAYFSGRDNMTLLALALAMAGFLAAGGLIEIWLRKRYPQPPY